MYIGYGIHAIVLIQRGRINQVLVHAGAPHLLFLSPSDLLSSLRPLLSYW